MNQIPLSISSKLPYLPEQFILHAGVRQLVAECEALLSGPGFRISYVIGGERSGKTHLAVKLLDYLNSHGRLGQELSNTPGGLRAGSELRQESALIMDDAHLYFSSLGNAGSGEFVDLVEECRVRAIPIVLLSSLELSELPVDDHIRSRLVPGSGLRIGNPQADDLDQLLSAMAKQRGLHLPESKLKFLLKRLPRSISSLEECLENINYVTLASGQPPKFSVLARP
ncbi:MAG: hypothetical protein DCC75_09625 [Proteobacteria bacterium]|nr:MAG: hypothetical protein DCC75_09625 [Pseudomonadota bacterium]